MPARPTVLVVEHEPALRQFEVESLEAEAYSVLSAAAGAAAVRWRRSATARSTSSSPTSS